MVNLFRLVQDKLLHNNAYTLLSLLVTLFILSILVSLFTIHFVQFDYDYLYFYYDALYTQSLSMIENETQYFDYENGCSYDQLFYYPLGIVNKAQTVNCNNHNLIIHLGSGNINEK